MRSATKNKKLSVVFAAAECAPFAKVGGLGDVIGSLPQALAKLGIDVSVILPKYKLIDERFGLRLSYRGLFLTHEKKRERFHVFSALLPKTNVTYHFIDHPALRSKTVYSKPKRLQRKSGATISASNDIERFSLFSRAVVEMVNQTKRVPDIIHCHDWHTALIPGYVDELAIEKKYPFTKTILTIHNLASQGITTLPALLHLDLTSAATPYLLEDYYDLDNAQLNLMKLGILSADKITTVSPSYAKEIATREYGAGLESFLARRRQKDLIGILNGIDTEAFNPTTDRALRRKYSARTVSSGKAANKRQLQQGVGLPVSQAPLYGMVSRLVSQKGLDILIPALESFLKNHEAQIIVLGSGASEYEDALRTLQKKHPEHVVARIGFDLGLAQRIYAGSDFFLMPSQFEPCGLGQMIAMRYGSLPIVRATGGLKDTVQHKKTGIVFTPYTPEAVEQALNQSLTIYRNVRTRGMMIARAMRKDFSWNRSARQYLKLYQSLA